MFRKKPWVLLIEVIGYISYVLALVTRQLRGIQSIPRTIDITQFFRVYKGATIKMLESIRQDWKSLVLIKREIGVRNPTVSEKYPRWRNGEVINIVRTSEFKGNQRNIMDGKEELRE
jgi:hypothetical protein